MSRTWFPRLAAWSSIFRCSAPAAVASVCPPGSFLLRGAGDDSTAACPACPAILVSVPGLHYDPTQVRVVCDTGLTPLYCESIVEAVDVTVGKLLTKDPPSYDVTWKDTYTAPAHAVELLDEVDHVRFARPLPFGK